jgi:hypothetical protein
MAGEMTHYLIWSHTQRKFVAPPGQTRSFVDRVLDARRFKTRQEAKANCCGDERVERWTFSAPRREAMAP